MDDVWQWAIGAVAIGIMSGLAGAGLLMMALTKGREDDSLYRDSARSMAISCFVFFTLAGVVIAISIVNRDSFEDVPSALVDVLPRLLVAGLVLVVGRSVALAAGSLAAKGMVAASGRVREQLALVVRTVITAAAIVIALGQVGVDTTLLQITGGALLFGLAAAAALLVGFGGRDLAAEIAAGRYLARLLAVGDRIELDVADGVLAGEVVGMHPATLELRDDSGVVHHLSNSRLMKGAVRTRPDDSIDGDQA
jgi:hypothetical protein